MKVLDTHSINIVNDVSFTKLRTRDFNSSGGNKVFISTDVDRIESFFETTINADTTLTRPISCKIDKQSLINYMHNIFFEYKGHNLQEYKDDTKVNLAYWKEKYLLIQQVELDNLNFSISSITKRAQGQRYFQGDDGSAFENYLWIVAIPKLTRIEIEKHEIGTNQYEYIFKPFVEFNSSVINDFLTTQPAVPLPSSPTKAINTIYFGSPGTGKSHQADIDTEGSEVYKVTFHPEYDYHSFVGGYKPAMNGKSIEYKFVPQVFTNAYVDAWNNYESDEPTKNFNIQLEEINRGNCAEIFGDLFQLLDRDSNGHSKYGVQATEELKNYLVSNLKKENSKGLFNNEIKFSPNLSLIATMNTSDQSLFPMDSAFKRRWDWEYIPINYTCLESDFTLILENGVSYKWLEFLKRINTKIFDATHSQDKQIGNWFINATSNNKKIDQKTFINKILFYLWNDVFKDEEDTIFVLDDGDSTKQITYENFFPSNNQSAIIIQNILHKHLDLSPIIASTTSTQNTEVTEEE